MYENAKIYKEKLKAWHDHNIRKGELHLLQKVLFLNSHLRVFLGKLKSYWFGLFVIKEVFLHGTVEITSLNGTNVFKVSGQRVKVYYEDEDRIEVSINLH